MLHRNLTEFLERCREYDFAVSLLSNLTLLTDDLVREMKKNKVLGVQASLYSMDPDIHDSITGMKGSLDRTKRGLVRLFENGVPVQISCPIIKQNMHSYRDVISWAGEYGISVSSDYSVIGRYDHDPGNLVYRLSTGELGSVIDGMVRSDPAYFERLRSDRDSKKCQSREDHVCSVCSSSICINEAGNVYPCAGWQDFIVGGIKESSLEDIWNKSERVRYLRDVRRSAFPHCAECGDRDFCTVCMVRNANEDPNGDPLVVSGYFCKVASLNKKAFLKMEGVASES
jgi:radical SAM protein with 4Fe4S-binding SPASM domain